MALFGFSCSKNALIALNITYIIVAVILIGVGVYAKQASYITSLSVTGGIVAAGVFLVVVSILGLVGSCSHHQVALFFYMVILFLVFLLQFAVAVACLSVNQSQRHSLAYEGWHRSSNATRVAAMKHFNCCGLDVQPTVSPGSQCETAKPSCCHQLDCSRCEDCAKRLDSSMSEALRITGCIGLFFSFTELFGIWLANQFRNLRDPLVVGMRQEFARRADNFNSAQPFSQSSSHCNPNYIS